MDSLDLAPSLPFWAAYVRARLKEYAEDIERLMHAHMAHKQSVLVPLEYMEVRFSSAYEAMHRMAQDLALGCESIEWRNKLPSGERIKGCIQVLAEEWERRAKTLHPTLFTRANEDADMAPSMHMPYKAVRLSEEVQKSVANVRHYIQNITIPSLRETSTTIAQDAQAMLPQSMALHDLPHHVEEAVSLIRRRGKEAGAQFVHAVQDVEDALYHAALQLARNGRELISYHALPELWRNNDFILTGYRFIPKDQWKDLLLSVFRVHNETGNIHTHTAGLMLVGVLFWFTRFLDSPSTTTTDRWIVTMYLLAAVKCLICSVSWHVIAGCADVQWFMCFACIDYTGISWLVAASLETVVYNGFYCQPGFIALYTVGVVALGTTMSILPWSAWFNDPRSRTIRISLFVGMACVGFVPFIHGTALHGYSAMASFYAPLVPSFASYTVGVLLYSMRWPERWAPGKFDIVGHSHQLWHVAIVLAIYFHYQAVLSFHEHREAYSCAAGYTPSPTLSFLSQTPGLARHWLHSAVQYFSL